MIKRFECAACRIQFESEGTRKDWTSSLYGPCFEYLAPCPTCGAACKEYRAKGGAKWGGDPGPLCDSPANCGFSGGCCGGGGCSHG